MGLYAKFGEDDWLLNSTINKLPERGWFVDVGSHDGQSCSNTLAFEEKGWDGILIEPDPEIAEKCRRFRKARTVPCAIGCPSNKQLIETVPFHVNAEDRGKSGLRGNGKEIAVLMLRLDYLLWLYEVPRIDLLSIDTEGTELECWDSLSNSKIRPTIVIMEHLTEPNPSQADVIVARMKKDGYSEIHRTYANLIFRLL